MNWRLLLTNEAGEAAARAANPKTEAARVKRLRAALDRRLEELRGAVRLLSEVIDKRGAFGRDLATLIEQIES